MKKGAFCLTLTYYIGQWRNNFRFFTAAFLHAVAEAKIEDLRFHDLRHTFASQLLLKGGTLKDVQELLGHKSMTMTLRYSHLTQEHKRNAVNLLNDLPSSNPAENVTCHKTVTKEKPKVGAFG